MWLSMGLICPAIKVLMEIASFSKLGLEKKFVVGYIGTLGMAHDLENVLSAASLMVDNKDIMFLFVGSGADKEKLENIAQKENLKKCYIFR